MTDNYEFTKSSRAQEMDDYSPYVDKQYNNYINDLNGGVYQNTSLSLVQFDMGQIYNSQKFTNTEDLVLVIPITMVAAYATGAANVVTAGGSAALLPIKNNIFNLIHQVDLQINGKTIESPQPFVNIAKNLQVINEMSINDLKQLGHHLDFLILLIIIEVLNGMEQLRQLMEWVLQIINHLLQMQGLLADLTNKKEFN